jgi:hypothetical protein
MKKIFTYIALFSISMLTYGQADIYVEEVTSAGNVAATISNLGIIGNSFSGSFNVEGKPSCEYPAGSGIEHIFDGGLWVGGLINGEVAVSTGAVDASRGYSTGGAGFEFTSKNPLVERSALFNSPFFDPQAISHQDFSSTFYDTSLFVNTASSRIRINSHNTPLGIQVDFSALNWNFSFANFFVILNFEITNINSVPIDSVFIGYWMDGVVRNVNITPPGGSAFFNKGGNNYIDSLGLAYEFDATGDVGFTDSYVGIKYLGGELNGACPANESFDIHYNTWQFQNTSDPLYFFPTTDVQKYNKMTVGLNQLPDWPVISGSLNSPNNRSTLLSAGPFTRLEPGETVEVAFAVICARRVLDGLPATSNTPAQQANLIQNAGWAQTAYLGEDANNNCVLDPGEDRDGNQQITRFILPTPPDAPKMKVIAGNNRIDVYWSDNAEQSVDPISKEQDFEGFRLYKTAVGFDVQNTADIARDLNQVGAWDIPANVIGFDNGFEDIRLPSPVTFEGDSVSYYYHYVFENVPNGWQHVIALTAFDRGDEVNNLISLESSPLVNLSHVFAGKPANSSFAQGDPFVYPNPYNAGAFWEGASTFEEDRKLIFANLPAQAEVRIYTAAGDLVDVFDHEQSYKGDDSRWFNTYSDTSRIEFSGGEHAWDLLSRDNQIISRGLYLFVVTDRSTGEKKQGKFVIIK